MTSFLLLLSFIIAFSILLVYIFQETEEIYEDRYGTHWRITKRSYEGHDWWIIEYDSPFGTWHTFSDWKREGTQLVPCHDSFNTEQSARDFLKSHIQ